MVATTNRIEIPMVDSSIKILRQTCLFPIKCVLLIFWLSRGSLDPVVEYSDVKWQSKKDKYLIGITSLLRAQHPADLSVLQANASHVWAPD